MKKPARYGLALSLLGLLPCTSALASNYSQGCLDPNSSNCGDYLWSFASLSVVNNAVTATGSANSAVAPTPNISGTTITSSASGWHAANSTSQMATAGVTDLNTGATGATGIAVKTDGDNDNNGTSGIDNKHGYDLVIFAFNEAVTLTGITFGSVNGDADFQLFAYNDAWQGAGTVDADPLNNQFEYNSTDNTTTPDDASRGLTYVGWDLLGSYGSASTTTPSVTSVKAQTIGTGVVRGAKFWAVGAYSATVLGGTTVGSPIAGNDAFKLQKLSGNLYVTTPPPGVPEPATLSLLALGALGAMRLRRRAS